MDSIFCGKKYWDAECRHDDDGSDYERDLMPMTVVDDEFMKDLFPPLHWTYSQIKETEERRLDLYKRALLHCEAWLMMSRLGYLQYYEAMAHPEVPLQALAREVDKLFHINWVSDFGQPVDTLFQVDYNF